MSNLKYKRGDILARLRASVAEGRPIIGAGASAGIIAKCAELGGADLIIVYSSGLYRIWGLPTSNYLDSNPVTLSMAEELLNVVRDTPVIGGVHAGDPRYNDLTRLLAKFAHAGYTGIINYYTVALYDDERRMRDKVGFGWSREVEVVRLARSRDMFTMAYVFNPEEARDMAEAGADSIVAHVGATAGGLVGFEWEKGAAFAAERVQKMIEAARAANPEIICLAHGGPFAEPEDTRYLYEHSDAQGFVGASSIERIPVERAVKQVVEEFKSIRIK
jgi:predicted TIM-barrel enzyme